MARSLPVAMAMLVLGACASARAPVVEPAARFTEGVYRFGTSDVLTPQSTSVSYQCDGGTCVHTSSRVMRRVNGFLALDEDGGIKLEMPNHRCSRPSPDSWRDEDVRIVSFSCGDARFILNSSGGMALYRVERTSTVQGNCARYTVDMQGRRTNICAAYHTRTETRRETVQFDLIVQRISQGAS